MPYSNELVAGKLRRWERFLLDFRLPPWEQIPDIGLYMEQVTEQLRQYLDYLPMELKEEQFITAATINNYVRTKLMPQPRRRRYYREHLAYLIIILTLKQSLSIALIRKQLPPDPESGEIEMVYRGFVQQHAIAVTYFTDQIRQAAGPILQHDVSSGLVVEQTEALIAMSAIISGFCRLLSQKLLLLEGKTLENGGSIAIHQP